MIGECSGCVFYVPLNTKDPYTGSCHRRAPQPVSNVHAMALRLLADIHWKLYDGKETNFSEGMKFEDDHGDWINWPSVDDTDGCGDFNAKEAA